MSAPVCCRMISVFHSAAQDVHHCRLLHSRVRDCALQMYKLDVCEIRLALS